MSIRFTHSNLQRASTLCNSKLIYHPKNTLLSEHPQTRGRNYFRKVTVRLIVIMRHLENIEIFNLLFHKLSFEYLHSWSLANHRLQVLYLYISDLYFLRTYIKTASDYFRTQLEKSESSFPTNYNYLHQEKSTKSWVVFRKKHLSRES